MTRILAFPLFVLALTFGWAAMAQEQSPEEEKSGFLRFIEDRLSTPERRIAISNIEGILSQDASIDEITISDEEGVYLRIENAAINWNQGALLGGRLEIRSLRADLIEYLRNPVPADPSLPPPEAGGLEIPEFPVAVILQELTVPRVVFGEEVFGLTSEISLSGNFVLEGGSLDADLDIVRLDGPGGTLSARIDYVSDTQNIDVDVTLTEPENGIIANLLNIEGRPEVALNLAGSGPVTDLSTQLTFDAGGRRALTGTAEISQAPGGFVVTTDLRGPIAQLVAERYRPFFGEESALTANAVLREEGGLSINSLRLSGGQLTLEASAETTPDNFLRTLQLNALIESADDTPVTLPIAGGATQVDEAQILVDYGRGGSDGWTGSLVVNGLETAELRAETLTLAANGVAANLDTPGERRITFNGDGTLAGIVGKSEEIRAALGQSIGFGIAGLWQAGEPVELAELRIEGEALALAASGEIDDYVFDGDIALNTVSMAPFSGIAGRELSGSVDLRASGTVSPLIGGFNLAVDGTANDLGIGEETADRLLDGDIRLTGRLARTQAGIEAEQFTLSNPQLSIVADGTFASTAADFDFNLDLADLALLTPEASGALSVTGSAMGSEGTIALELDARVPNGTLQDRPLREAVVAFTGELKGGVLDGNLQGSAFLDAFRVSLTSAIADNGEERRFSGLSLEAGGAALRGDLTQNAQGLLEGRLELEASDISTAAALLMAEASGAANAIIDFSVVDGEQAASITGRAEGLDVAGVSVGSADIEAEIGDIFGVPAIEGRLAGSDIRAAGTEIASLSAEASRSGETTRFGAQAELATGTQVSVTGDLAALDQGYRLALQSASLQQGELTARLAAPAALTVDGSSVNIDDIVFDVGGGRIAARGSAGEALDIVLDINALPLSIANAINPELGLGGTVNGTATITGTASNPHAQFNLTGEGVEAAALDAVGATPLSFTTSGRYADQAITLATLDAQGAGGLSLAASGTVPLRGEGLALDVTGSAPLALADRFVSERGGQVSGTVTLDARVTGSLGAPQFAGQLSTSGAEYIDPAFNLRIQNISGSATLSGSSARIERLTGTLATGGTVAVTGTLGLDAPRFPVDLALRLNSARYADGSMVVATLTGDLALTGALAQSPLLSGNIFVERAEVTIPNTLGGAATLIDVDHVAPPPPVVRTLERANADDAAPRPRDRPSIVQLDVTLNAPNQVFLRGRGLDAELGGSVRLTGPVTMIQPVGGFELIRGRLAILGQRVTFDRGTLTLVGDLDPFIDLEASTEGDDITVYVTLSGRVSEAEVQFSSDPDLPQDEVLARLIFNRSMGELSPLQLARLAGAAAELAGGGGSLVDSFREASGLADLDIVTDEEGNVAVQAGQYIQENVYLGVQAGANGQSRVTINLDVTDDIKARGSVDAEGNSDIGVFYEEDY